MVETIREVSASDARVALFDFDGTLSLIRTGWMQVMVPMMVEVLAELSTGETEDQLRTVIEDFVWRLTGRETIYQMIALAAEVEKRGGTPLPPLAYKRRYLDRLHAVIADRLRELRGGLCSPDKYLVPGARALLESLRSRGLRLYLASGTDEVYMKEEADLLDVSRYFDGGVYGALDDPEAFSKRLLVQKILALPGARGQQLLAFGDGYVEIEEVKQVGGVAVGVATDEPACVVPDEWKRTRLIGAGADYIVPNFTDEALLPTLFRPRSKYATFDRSRLFIQPLSDRKHDLHIERWMALSDSPPPFSHPDLPLIAERLRAAQSASAARILMMGAHVLRAGVNRHLIDLLERGHIDHIAMNGAGAIHDYELARIGATTESVDRYIRTGEFGLWRETGELNDWIREAADLGLGLGENVGRRIDASDYPPKDLSVFAAAYRAGVPVTVHAGIGYDILHEHPNCDGASLGAASYRDFLIFARTVERLENGVLLNFGSAIMGPEVYLKALAMSRNVARQEGRSIRQFTTAVFDLVPIQGDVRKELPKTDPGYYFRPHKTILVRTVADGGESYYFCGEHRATVPALWRELQP
ncbi:MAG TPA: HAD family hydrolase [Candidatus Sulfopaludibacter sp.]|jgi:phosphoglycolate phosphatase-like HAD superfamily hydrolase|nr:HAD family hydrolase [Candidatus Sulfopaludibacter sp.]